MKTNLGIALALLTCIPWLPAAEAPTTKAVPAVPRQRALAPGGQWKVGDTNRPRPKVILPAPFESPGQPPSDAIVLFDGKDLSAWKRDVPKNDPDKSDTPKWKIENGYVEVTPKSGSLSTRDQFGSCQLHIEWATPAEVKGSSQGRGNSGVFFLGHSEIQVLDSWQNDTYPDGQAAAIYSRFPPLVNASRKPGEWQSYDIIYMAPQLDAQKKVVKPATYTAFHNGVLAHHAAEVPGAVVECAIGLQNHGNPVRYRNIWLRKLKGYDEP